MSILDTIENDVTSIEKIAASKLFDASSLTLIEDTLLQTAQKALTTSIPQADAITILTGDGVELADIAIADFKIKNSRINALLAAFAKTYITKAATAIVNKVYTPVVVEGQGA